MSSSVGSTLKFAHTPCGDDGADNDLWLSRSRGKGEARIAQGGKATKKIHERSATRRERREVLDRSRMTDVTPCERSWDRSETNYSLFVFTFDLVVAPTCPSVDVGESLSSLSIRAGARRQWPW